MYELETLFRNYLKSKGLTIESTSLSKLGLVGFVSGDVDPYHFTNSYLLNNAMCWVRLSLKDLTNESIINDFKFI